MDSVVRLTQERPCALCGHPKTRSTDKILKVGIVCADCTLVICNDCLDGAFVPAETCSPAHVQLFQDASLDAERDAPPQFVCPGCTEEGQQPVSFLAQLIAQGLVDEPDPQDLDAQRVRLAQPSRRLPQLLARLKLLRPLRPEEIEELDEDPSLADITVTTDAPAAEDETEPPDATEAHPAAPDITLAPPAATDAPAADPQTPAHAAAPRKDPPPPLSPVVTVRSVAAPTTPATGPPPTASPAAPDLQSQMAQLLQLMTIQASASQQERAERERADREERAARAERERLDRQQMHQLLQALTSRSPPPPPDAPASLPHATASSHLLSHALKNSPLPRFSGDCLSFQNWFTAFSQRVDSSSLSASDKFLILRDHLEQGPLRKVEGLSFVDALSYDKAKDILQQAYGSAEEQRQVAIRKLYNVPGVEDKDYELLEAVTDDLRIAQTTLKSLGVTELALDLLVPAFLDKLPPTFLTNLRNRRSYAGVHTDPSFDEVLAALVNELKSSRIAAANETASFSGAALLAHSRTTAQKGHFNSRKAPAPSKAAPPTASANPSPAQPSSRPQKGANRLQRKPRPCRYCKSKGLEADTHREPACPTTDLKERLAIVRRLHLCPNCLAAPRPGENKPPHGSAEACIRGRCLKDQGAHHTSLCPTISATRAQLSVTQPAECEDVSPVLYEKDIGSDAFVMLAAPPAAHNVFMLHFEALVSRMGSESAIPVTAYGDSGASCCFITNALASRLRLRSQGSILLSSAACHSNERVKVPAKKVKLDLHTKDGRVLVLHALSVDVIAAPLNLRPASLPAELTRKLLPFQDILNLPPASPSTLEIQLLIGNDFLPQIIGPANADTYQISRSLVVHQTPFGSLLSGSIGDPEETSTRPNALLSLAEPATDPDSRLLEQLTDLRDLGIGKEETEDELAHRSRVIHRFHETTKRLPNGRFVCHWPYKQENPSFQSNFGPAMGALTRAWNKMKPEEREQYHALFMDYKAKNMLEKAPETADGPVRFHAHFPVRRCMDGKQKLRAVINTAQPPDPFNSYLESVKPSGPPLAHVLLRHRAHPFAAISDIKKFFLQIGLAEEERDSMSIALPDNPREPFGRQSPWTKYRYCRLIFGASASPFMTQEILERLFLQEPLPKSIPLLPHHSRLRLRNSFYADNSLISEPTLMQLQESLSNLDQITAAAQLPLAEYASNAPSVLDDIDASSRQPSTAVSLLGMTWHTDTDELALKAISVSSDTSTHLSRRQLLRIASLPYDTLGFFAPVLLAPRLLLHQPWAKDCPWDGETPDAVRAQFSVIRADLERLHSIRFPRCLVPVPGSPVRLVGMSDGSPEAWGYIIWVLSERPDGSHHVAFLLSRSKVTPRKPALSLPRIELLALYGVCIAISNLMAVFKAEWSLKRPILFTDSTCAQAWYYSNKELRKWERRRVDEMRKRDVESVRYIPTDLNSADLATHPQDLTSLLNSSYHCGPAFLSTPISSWPHFSPPEVAEGWEVGAPRVEKKGETTVALLSATAAVTSPFGLEPKAFSSLYKLFACTMLCQRFIDGCRKRPRPSHLHSTPEEYNTALCWWVRYTQALHEEKAVKEMRDGKPSHRTRQLGVMLDGEGLLRLEGRMGRTDLSLSLRHPLLIPAESELARLLTLHFHLLRLHAFPKATLSTMREQGLWITKGQTWVRRYIKSHCVPCTMALGKPLPLPPLGPVCPTHLTRSAPFTKTGMDEGGPVLIYEPGSNRPVHYYFLVFTCAITRACHLEMSRGLKTDAVLNSINRFICRRGLHEGSELHLDNLAAHHSATAALSAILHSASSAKRLLKDLPPQLRITYGQPLAPWSGQGHIETMVKAVKKSLKPACWRKRLDPDTFHTLLCRVEGMLNQRPLCEGDGPGDPPLTPACFLAAGARMDLPADDGLVPSTSPAAAQARAMKRRIDSCLDQFWQVFFKHYVSSLQQRHQYEKRRDKPQTHIPRVGGVYLLKNEKGRMRWETVRVTEIHPDPTGVVRFVTVFNRHGHHLKRSTSFLVPLELNGDCDGKETDEAAAEDGGTGDDEPPPDLGVSARTLRARARELRRRAVDPHPS